ncbi:MAG: DUF2162 domain-containing protein [Desulfobulbaceae bacterium]|jgi:predicted transporter|nr:DUF2162 domain-containing protein [Desulfobulbaceae bacterium]
MLHQLWITGILVAFSIFGIKVGLGLGVQLYNRSISPVRKTAFLTGSLLVYLLLFLAAYFLISRFNLLNYLDHLLNMLRYGMLIHLAVAFGLFIWGTRLLLANPQQERQLPLRASLPLILPCPICATVILLNLTLAISLLDLSPLSTTLALFGLFSGIILFTCALIFLFRRQISSTTSFLGQSMVMIALYFLLTVMIAPLFPEIKATFAMAVSNQPTGQSDYMHTAIMTILVIFTVGVGFIKTYYAKGVTSG